MKRNNHSRLTAFIVALGLSTGLGGAGTAHANGAAKAATGTETGAQADSRTVASIPLYSGLWSWRRIDDRTVILWTTPSRPYLVRLRFPSPDLKWTQAIGVTSLADRVYAGFDALQVRGLRYPIDSITRLTRDEARSYGREPEPAS